MCTDASYQLIYGLPDFFFYITWHVDWTLYFIGQVNYLKLNEAWLSYVNIGNAIVQFITIGFWSRLNNKFGVRFGIIFGNLGLAFCPICMIAATGLWGLRWWRLRKRE